MKTNEPVIMHALRSDLPAIWDVQIKAFREVARFFNLETLPALEQTLEGVIGEFEKGTILKACLGHLIVGSVRACQKEDTCYIGKLVVVPGYQNRGIGKALMRAIENQYRHSAKRYEIFTGSRDPKNRYLYDHLGYNVFKTERINEELTFVYMEKSANDRLSFNP